MNIIFTISLCVVPTFPMVLYKLLFKDKKYEFEHLMNMKGINDAGKKKA